MKYDYDFTFINPSSTVEYITKTYDKVLSDEELDSELDKLENEYTGTYFEFNFYTIRED